MSGKVTAQEALIYAMVTVSAADARMANTELMKIGHVVETLPAFAEFDGERLVSTAEAASEVLSVEDGLNAMLDTIAGSLPERLHDTAYALAVEVAAADLKVPPEEVRFLQLLRDRLAIDRLTAAAIERSAQARYRRG
jgi:tellurite resistance protein